jgi:predicted 2-oxoglutarate/Fe(II)-dependent dioxygenase YbiX
VLLKRPRVLEQQAAAMAVERRQQADTAAAMAQRQPQGAMVAEHRQQADTEHRRQADTEHRRQEAMERRHLQLADTVNRTHVS